MDNLITIRETEEVDLEQCIRILRDTYDDEDWKHKWTYKRGKRYLESCFTNYNFVSYVIEVAGTIKGAIFCHVKPWWDEDDLFIDELLIAKDIEDKGYDKKLLKMVEEYAKEEGLGAILLGTKIDSFGARFYKDNGFKVPEGFQIMHKKL